MFENRMLRRIFGSERGEMIRQWRKLHNDELYDSHSLRNIIKIIK
jgi:hypothetical protein